jgi:nicotinate dehydrogenase subunit B
MREQPDLEDLFEPERYELSGGPAYLFEMSRREFFKFFGGGAVIVLLLRDTFALQESGGQGRRGSGQKLPDEIGAWLHIGEDGNVTVYSGKVEMGQNIRTSLTQAVAEELRIPMSSVQLILGDTDLTPFDMGTFGSLTTPVMAPQLRRASAAARELLLDLAASAWNTDRNSLSIDSGKITNPATKQSLSFGQLTKGQKLLKAINGNISTTPPDRWEVAGKTVPKVNARSFVTGKHRYTSDMKLPGMLYGKILRPPAFGATLESIDTRAAESIPGVVLVRDGDFVGVAAPNEQKASRAASAIRAEWKTSSQPSIKEIFEYLKKNAAGAQEGRRTIEPMRAGNIEDGLAAADKKFEQSYTINYIAHVPLEPRAALAEWKGEKLTVWTGTQRPFGVRGELAQAFRIPEAQVRVIVPDTGSGYGGKHTGEAAIEAARLAKAAQKPVKIVWTRQEEFTWAYFRPAGVIDIRSGVSNDGTITAWGFRNYNSGAAAIRTPYDIANQLVEFLPSNSPLRQGSYRSLAAAANNFARESHMDELARAVNMDPLAFRYKNLKDPRLRAVLEAAAGAFRWGKTKPSPGHGFGLAGGFEKGGYVATCAEVSVDKTSGAVKILRVVTAFECGAIVNPDGLKNQVEGSVVMAIGGALFESIQFENGKILNPSLSRYRVPRFGDLPAIETVLIDRKDLPSAGAGETPLIGLAPAVGNAIFDAVGVRLRTLPMENHKDTKTQRT